MKLYSFDLNSSSLIIPSLHETLTYYDIIACSCPCHNKFLTSVKPYERHELLFNISTSDYLMCKGILPSAPPTYCPFMKTCGTCIIFIKVIQIKNKTFKLVNLYRCAAGGLCQRTED